MKRWTILLLLVLCLATLATAGFAAPQKPAALPATAPAQDSEPVTVDSARDVNAIVGEKTAYLATVSPDGKYIAYGKQSGKRKDRVLQLCLFEFETAAKKCSDLSPDVFNGYPYQFQWSPDSRYIAFTENPIEIASESDVWLFDSEAGIFTNLTDDGLVGVWSSFVADGDQVKLDILPMWNANDSQIYFWRIQPLGNMRFTIGLYSISPEGGDPTLVRDLTANFAAMLPLYDYQLFFLDGVSALSPDGTKVAALMSNFNDMGATQQTLYLIDIADTSVEPQVLGGPAEFSSALPEWALDFPPQAQGLSWTGDGAGIVVVVNDPVSTMTPFQVYYYIDAASGEVKPVVDFTGVEEMDNYGDPAPGSDLPWRAYSPWTGSLSPAGDKLLMINDLGGTVAVFTSPLPPAGELPVVSASSDESPTGGPANSSRGEGGKVVAYGLLLNITEQ